jgi:CheY-like chemotaxis protein
VKNLLIFSRQGHHESAPFDCNKAVRESLSLLSHSLDKKIEISLEAHDGPLIVIGDQSLLESAILNLAVNAQDAMPTGGMLTIRTFKRTPNAITIAAHPHLQNVSAFVAVSVSDTGKGIDDRIRDRLFEPFVTTKETGKGTGLGLASVYGTAKALGGCIDVESEKGRGTTFTIYLPLSDRAAAIETASQAMPFSGNGESIMIIDDEDIILKAEEMALTKQGYSVKAFSNPAFALDYYRDRQAGVSCIILDMVMPKMNGKMCFERLRAINPGVKVILTTGYAGDPDFDAFIKSSGVLFVPKPFDAQIMGKAIRKALGKQGRGGAA